MSESTSSDMKFMNSLPDWGLRAAIFVVFLFFGAGKFKSDAQAPWVVLYGEIGFGQWFRYFTAVIETIGAFLVLIPQTVTAGLATLGLVLTGAVLIDLIVLHRAADTFVPFAILCALVAFWLHRRRV
jgi:putative oxidoreductase